MEFHAIYEHLWHKVTYDLIDVDAQGSFGFEFFLCFFVLLKFNIQEKLFFHFQKFQTSKFQIFPSFSGVPNIQISNLVDLRGLLNLELVMRIKTDIGDENRLFFTDSNGFQVKIQ